MGSGPHFRLRGSQGRTTDVYDPWGLFRDGGLRPPTLGRPAGLGDRQLRLRPNVFEPDHSSVMHIWRRVQRAEQLREAIPRIALAEWQAWQDESGTETSNEGSVRVRKYFRAVGRSIPLASLRQSSWHSNSANNPQWSAAFVSWVMKEAGALPDFRRAWKHTTFFYHAKQARRELFGPLFKAYPASGAGAVVPEPGDVIMNQVASHSLDYDHLRPSGHAHSDIVVDVTTHRDQHRIVVIGGNVASTSGGGGSVVGEKRVQVDASGRLQNATITYQDGTASANAVTYVSVMKIEAVTSSLLARGATR